MEKGKFASAIVLGMNDALIEVTGTLVGMTLAISDPVIIGATGVILGVAASISMAASEFLSSEELREDSAFIEAVYTGMSYILTVAILVAPYFIFNSVITACTVMIVMAFLAILFYSSYISATGGKGHFWKKFREMSMIFIIVMVISAIMGLILEKYVNGSPR